MFISATLHCYLFNTHGHPKLNPFYPTDPNQTLTLPTRLYHKKCEIAKKYILSNKQRMFRANNPKSWHFYTSMLMALVTFSMPAQVLS